MNPLTVIRQPDFLPHTAFLHRLLQADIYVALDHVQFVNGTRAAWTNRDRIKTARGVQWLTVPVRAAPRRTAINQIELAPGDWKRQNLNLLRENYQDAPFFAAIFPEVETLYSLDCNLLVDFTIASIEMLMRLLDIRTPIVRSSTLSPAGSRNELLVDILRRVGSTRYLSGTGAMGYFDTAPFMLAGIEVTWHKFSVPSYPQLHGDFIPSLSSIDMLFNCGIERSRALLRSVR